jgi:protein-disulfide isomerase
VVYDIDTARNPVRGPVNAPISIVEFSDFQCPYCAGIQKTLEEVLRAFPKDVRIVFKQYPLNIHQYARQAAAASLAAHAQGKFWEMHDKLFQNFTAINEENIRRWAETIGMDMGRFEREMQRGAYEAAVQKDMADGAAAKVLGTPTLFINGKRIRERSFDAFKVRIQEELAMIRSGRKRASTVPTPN